MAAGGRQWGGEGGEVGMGLAVGMAMRTWGWGHGAGDMGLGPAMGQHWDTGLGTRGWVWLWGSSGDMGLGPAMGTAIGTQG